MQLEFKVGRRINGKFYAPGVHEFSEAMMNHWFIQAMMKSGKAVPVTEKLKSKKSAVKKEAAIKKEE